MPRTCSSVFPANSLSAAAERSGAACLRESLPRVQHSLNSLQVRIGVACPRSLDESTTSRADGSHAVVLPTLRRQAASLFALAAVLRSAVVA